MLQIRKVMSINFILLPTLLFFIVGCMPMSEIETEKSAGINGGFEIIKNGLPVNWNMYTPKTVKDADFAIVIDTVDCKESKNSLRFIVKRCSSIGGHFSPGFTNEFLEFGKFEGKARYKLSFWVKNEGSTFKISAGGVSSKNGDMKTLIEESNAITEWKLLEYIIDIPQNKWLRLELNILKPGTFWIDGVKIEKE